MKKICSLLFVFSFLALFVISFAGCSLFKGIDLEEVKGNLENAGYTVSVMTGEEYIDTDDAVPAITSAELE